MKALKDMSVHFSSETDLHATPKDFFDKLNNEFGFEIDVCANSENAKCEAFYTKEIDGLKQNWGGMVCWMNPPYGDPEHICKKSCKKKKCQKRGFHNTHYVAGIKDWLRKANEESKRGATIVCLVPARTDTRWWHEYVIQHEVRFVRGRLKFGNAKNCAPFPSAVVVIKPFVGGRIG